MGDKIESNACNIRRAHCLGLSLVYNITIPLFEIAPYATFCILLLIIVATVYLRSAILNYTQKNLPHNFREFKLHEEHQAETKSLALYHYIMSNAFEQTNDPVFIAMCRRYIRWGQSFILFFVLAIVDLSVICRLLSLS